MLTHPGQMIGDAWFLVHDGLATGSVLRWQDRFWMAYSSNRTAQVGVAVSDDLMTWTRHPGNPVTGIDPRYYEETGSGTRPLRHWRDPFLWTDGDAICDPIPVAFTDRGIRAG